MISSIVRSISHQASRFLPLRKPTSSFRFSSSSPPFTLKTIRDLNSQKHKSNPISGRVQVLRSSALTAASVLMYSLYKEDQAKRSEEFAKKQQSELLRLCEHLKDEKDCLTKGICRKLKNANLKNLEDRVEKGSSWLEFIATLESRRKKLITQYGSNSDSEIRALCIPHQNHPNYAPANSKKDAYNIEKKLNATLKAIQAKELRNYLNQINYN